ncbi:ATP-grasp domain-containing protein [Streptomyces hainanensis]|uniref:ATP-grasp domain-containing protein n=1 Tax=Streptomyces hainanensis TaxID=402648 RepID=A0A4R4SQD1_9ACTN|nr:ATP-grasp domain-containing protein [Streptomyces hainanensis]TDC66127.1 ATP-grasp domain-containing protein [Streptomyces hainanensis]
MTPQSPVAVLLSPRPAVVEAARRVGARTLVLAPDLSRPGVREAAGAADQAITVDWTDHPQLMMAIGHLTNLPARVCVFGFTEASALIAARANEALRFPGNPHAAVAYLTDKAALRGKVNQLTGAPVRFEHCDRAAHLVAAAERVGFPCVAKPRTGSGGQDVHLLRSAADAADLAAQLSGEPALIVEEFLDGPEFSIEAHSRAGEHTILAITRKYGAVDTVGVGVTEYRTTGYDMPADLDEDTRERIHRLVVATLNAAGQRGGLSQTEVIVTADGPRLIESHAHPGATFVQELLRLATGTDPIALGIASALELPPPEPAFDDRRCAGSRFLRLPAGLLEAVEGIAEARAIAGVRELEITVPVGSHVPEATSRVAGHGYVTAVADSPQELDAVLRKAMDTLRPVVAPAPSVLSGAMTSQFPRDVPREVVKEEEHTAA